MNMAMIKMVIASTLALVTLLGVSAAQQVSTATITIPLFDLFGNDFGPETPAASVVEATPQGATTLKIGCNEGPEFGGRCAFTYSADLNLTYGPKIHRMESSNLDGRYYQDCNTKHNRCTQSMTYSGYLSGAFTRFKADMGEWLDTATPYPILVTAGAEKLEGSSLPPVPSPTVTIPFYGHGTQAIIGSVIDATSNGATTYGLQCADFEYDSLACELVNIQTLTLGPSTYNMYIKDSDGYTDFTMSYDCNTAASTCVLSLGGREASHQGFETSHYGSEDVVTLPVTVVSGGEKLETWPAMLASATSAAAACSSASTAKPAAHGPSAAACTFTGSQDAESAGPAAATPKTISWTIGIFAALVVVIGY